MAAPNGAAEPAPATQKEVDQIVKSGPSGAFAVAGIAASVVVVIYFAFYLFAYLPRGIVR